MSKTSRRTGCVLLFAGCLGWSVVAVRAQPPARNADADAVESRSLTCWWTADRRAVRVGEPFGLTLTCRAMETDGVKVVPNLAELEPTSIELTPFEVLDGRRHNDIVEAPWRYVQFNYTVRLLGEEFFGRDVAIPATNVTFRVQTGGAETVEGAEHRYVLPAIPMRILSLLPAQAADIRDPAVDSFAAVEARRTRATMELVAAAVLFGFAAIPAVVAGVRVRERFRKGERVIAHTVPPRTLLDACVREIERVRGDGLAGGWTSGLAGRALAPFRVAGAIALQQPITQASVAADAPVREGQMALRHGLLRRRRTIVSAPTTAESMARRRASANGGTAGDSRADVLDPIREALTALSAVRYGRAGEVDVQALDRTLQDGCSALRRMRAARWWPVVAVGALPRPAALFRGAWSR